jgi:hypothetical protein
MQESKLKVLSYFVFFCALCFVLGLFIGSKDNASASEQTIAISEPPCLFVGSTASGHYAKSFIDSAGNFHGFNEKGLEQVLPPPYSRIVLTVQEYEQDKREVDISEQINALLPNDDTSDKEPTPPDKNN